MANERLRAALDAALGRLNEDALHYEHGHSSGGEPLDPDLFVNYKALRAALADAPLPSEPDSCDGLCSVTHEHALPSDTPADGLDVERLTRALWVVEFEAEEGPYEHASEANVIDVTDLAEAIAREYAALALTQEPRSAREEAE